ncbi:MAG: o-succinylbenzoate synthase [Balneolaceae bacterium]
MQFRFTPYEIPLKTPFKTAAGTVTVREGVLLELRFDATGIRHRAEAAPLPGFSRETIGHVLDRLHRDQEIITQFFRSPTKESAATFLQSYQALPSLAFALSALLWQIELHSLEAASGETVHPTEQIQINAVAGLLSPDALLHHLTQKYRQGFRVFKCKVGLHPQELADTLHTFARIHRDVLFRLDANRSWPVDHLEAYSSLFSELPVQYIEEPAAIDRPEQLEKVLGRCKLPVALDESIQSPDQLERFARSDAARSVAAWIIKPTLFGDLYALRTLLDQYHLSERTVFTSSFETGVGRALIGWLAAHYGSANFAHGLDTGDLFSEELEKLPGGPLLRYSDCLNLIRPPDFRWQDRDLFFMSRTGIYTWTDLDMFSKTLLRWLAAEKIDLNRPMLLSAQGSDEMLLLMAACYRSRIAMLIIPPETPWNTMRERIATLPEPTRPQAGFIETEDREKALDHGVALDKDSVLGITSILTRSDLHSFLSSSPDHPEWVPSVQESHQNTLACIMFTSGSAGTPKAIPILRSQIESAANAAAPFMKPDPGCMSHLMLPLYHIGGASILFRSLIYETPILLQLAGSTQTESEGARRTPDLAETARILQHNPLIQITSMVPTQLMRLLRDHDLQVHPSMKTILLGGGPVNRDLMDLIGKKQGESGLEAEQEVVLPVRFSFGMTETAAMILSGTLMDQPSDGPWLQVHPPNEAEIRPWVLQLEPESESHQPEKNAGKVVREEEDSVEGGSVEGSREPEEGLLWVRGPQVVPQMDEGQIFDSDGWFCTGDIATRRGNWFRIEMKREDRIVTGGKNVDPREVENRLREIGWIRDVVLIGVPDPEWGQKVIAFVVADGVGVGSLSRDGNVEAQVDENLSRDGNTRREIGEIIKASLRGKLEAYKIPKQCILLDKIPRTELQKVKRADLLALWESNYSD